MKMPFTQADLDHLFTYHAPVGNQLERYQSIRSAARVFAEIIVLNTPVGADQSAAVRLVREATMTANQSIALEKQGPDPAIQQAQALLLRDASDEVSNLQQMSHLPPAATKGTITGQVTAAGKP